MAKSQLSQNSTSRLRSTKLVLSVVAVGCMTLVELKLGWQTCEPSQFLSNHMVFALEQRVFASASVVSTVVANQHCQAHALETSAELAANGSTLDILDLDRALATC